METASSRDHDQNLALRSTKRDADIAVAAQPRRMRTAAHAYQGRRMPGSGGSRSSRRHDIQRRRFSIHTSRCAASGIHYSTGCAAVHSWRTRSRRRDTKATPERVRLLSASHPFPARWRGLKSQSKSGFCSGKSVVRASRSDHAAYSNRARLNLFTT